MTTMTTSDYILLKSLKSIICKGKICSQRDYNLTTLDYILTFRREGVTTLPTNVVLQVPHFQNVVKCSRCSHQNSLRARGNSS